MALLLRASAARPPARACTTRSAGARAQASPPAAYGRRTAAALLPLLVALAAGAARAEDFVPTKLSTKLAPGDYTTLEASYKEKDETVAGDVGRFAAFTGAFALVVAFLTNSPVEIKRRILLAQRADEEAERQRLAEFWKAEWDKAIKDAASRRAA